MKNENEDVLVKFPEKALFLLSTKSRYKVLYGGRGSAKTESIGRALIIISMSKKVRILCARQIQNSIADSVYKVLCDIISEMGLEDFFYITKDRIVCTLTGSDFFFKGIVASIKEIKSTKGVNYCWVEEGESVSEKSWDVLIPTIREPESEIWVSFNPNLRTDVTYEKFVLNPPENCISVEMNYNDNPFFPEVLRQEMEACKKLNYAKYEHIWLGIPNSEAGNLIKMNKFKRYKIPPERFDRLFITCDTAFSEKKSADDSCFLLGGVIGHEKYILDVYVKKVSFVELCRDLKSFYMAAKENYKKSFLSTIYIENKASGISLTQQLRTEGLPIKEIYPTVRGSGNKEITADKYTRFLEIEADLDSGYVYLPESAHWLPVFQRECEAFTGGKQSEHDDIVDCLTYFLKIARQREEPDWNDLNRQF